MAAIPEQGSTLARWQTDVQPFSPPALRSQAEAKLREHPAPLVPQAAEAGSEEIQRMLHDLQVHQIELEMQNEELQRREQELNAANRRYSDLYDHAPVGRCTLSESDEILQLNLAASALLGMERSALVGQPFFRWVYSEDMDTYYLMRRALLRTGQTQRAEFRMRSHSGTPFWGQVVGSLSHNADGTHTLHIMISDISELKQAQAAQARSDAKYQAALEEQVARRTQQFQELYDHAPCGYHSLTLNGVIARVNKTELALLGYAEHEYLGHAMLDFMAPQSAPIFREAFARLVDTGSARHVELELLCKDGCVRPFVMDAHLAKSFSNEAPLCHATLVDISERKHNEQRLELALMGADLGLWDHQVRTGELHLSARACAMLGYPEGGIGGHISDFERLVHPDDEPVRQEAHRAINNGEVSHYRVEYRLRHRDGHWVWFRSQGRIVARNELAEPLRSAGTLQNINQERQLKREGADLLQRIESLIQGLGKAPQASTHAAEAAQATGIGARELQVMQLIAAGCTSAEIGEQLGISTSTAATHRRNLMRKLDLHSSAELTRYAVTHQLIHR